MSVPRPSGAMRADGGALHLALPGPAERAILGDLGGGFTERAIEAHGAVLRVLEGGPPDAAPLVLLHGRGGAATSWWPVVASLAARRRVIAFDLPGFGRSRPAPSRPAPRTALEARDFFVEPIEQAMLALGLAGAPVAGHSLGGLIALELALRGRARPSHVAVIASMGLGPRMHAGARLFFRLHPERLSRVLGARVLARLVPPAPQPFGAGLAALEHELYRDPSGRTAAARAFDRLVPLLGPSFSIQARLGTVTAKVLLIAGDGDPVFPLVDAIAARAALRDARLEVLPVGHAPVAEAPHAVAALLESFLG